ncbi:MULTISPECIES: hypothetical protein [Tabrizicola]|uniref:hypothetical protein n=1 Tax=Tabrizicola TaxID=1443919 RepID=UPI00108068A5|nr:MULTISPECIES: hypothetical protein [Paracoccaceae]
MFGREDELLRLVFALGLGMTFLSALLTWVAAWRYGRRRALVVPVLALVAVAVLALRGQGLDAGQATQTIAFAMVFAGPAVAGALLGLGLSALAQRHPARAIRQVAPEDDPSCQVLSPRQAGPGEE